MIQAVKQFGWKEVSVFIPDCVKDDDDALTVKIGLERAKMENISLILKNSPDDILANAEFNECEEKSFRYMQEKVESMLDLDLKHQRDKKINTENYYKWSKCYLSQSGFLTANEPKLSMDEKIKN
jgi:hypothetical protein